MSVAASPRLMSTDDLLAMPADGVDRWLIRGQLREKKPKNGMTIRNRLHSRVMTRVSRFLDEWLDRQPEPRGQVLSGEAGVRLRRDPDTTVGVDVVYIGHSVAAQQTERTTLVEGVPILVVEILSPSDTIDEINEKINDYLSAGVALVWVIDPYRRTVEIIRLGAEPKLVNVNQELSGEPELAGFRIPVARLFN